MNIFELHWHFYEADFLSPNQLANKSSLDHSGSDPLVVPTMDKEQMIDAIRDLDHFGFDEFRPTHGVIDDMIEESCLHILIVKSFRRQTTIRNDPHGDRCSLQKEKAGLELHVATSLLKGNIMLHC